MARDIFPLTSAPLGLAWILAASSALACTDDTTSVDEAGDDQGEDGTSGDDDSGDGDSSVLDNPPALGISITEVEANQGTAILIGREGEWVGPTERNAFMIRDRDTLIRLQHTVDPEWVPREITGVLHLTDPDGNELDPRIRTFFVEGPSDPKNLSSEFYFSILAEEAQPGVEYWIELLETDEDFDGGALAEGVTTTPSDFELIGYEQTPLEMKVMLVPIEYTYIDPPTLVDPTEADIQLVHDELLQNNPLQSVELEIHEPYLYDNHITNLGQLLSPMRGLRQTEGAPPNVYYHAIVDVRGPSVDMVAGIASLTSDTKSAGDDRVAATVWWKSDPELPPSGSAGTLVHEIGHNQGLSHVYCPNAATPAAGPDPNYPHEGGKIGVYGFGIRNFRLYTPTAAHDYMTYCGNAWVSDWTWNKTYRRIRTLTSWDYEGAEPELPDQPILVGTLFADGSEDWWLMMGQAPTVDELELDGGERIAISTGEGIVDEVWASSSMLSDHETKVVVAPLQVPLEQVSGLARVDGQGEVHPVALERLHVHSSVQLADAP